MAWNNQILFRQNPVDNPLYGANVGTKLLDVVIGKLVVYSLNLGLESEIQVFFQVFKVDGRLKI